ncbi:hypothetical protein LSCM1_05898 [Leishmania martiniquensis]|uniref:Uncharacterized protein n=1 Tax=Leishmania martiniquensis TaxID=1580590 RepID=A0A836H3E9_9TRYP|nr:hypothetical protein LSCM1_05898 [Leishmania martiniquensis]
MAAALREQRETTRLLARLLAGITLQWRKVMIDLAEGQVPVGIRDATAAVAKAAKLSRRAHTGSHHHHRRRSRSSSNRRQGDRSSLEAVPAVSTSYLAEELRFNVQGYEADRARSPSSPRPGEVHPYNCAGGPSASTLKSFLDETDQKERSASRTDTELRSVATSWDSLAPAIQWVPLLLYGGAAAPRDAGSDARCDSYERGRLDTSLYTRRSCRHTSTKGDESGDEGGYVGSSVCADGPLRRALLQGAAQSAEVIIRGMRQVREVLSAMAAANVIGDVGVHGHTRHGSHCGLHCSLDRHVCVSARSRSASSDAGADRSPSRTHRSRTRCQRTAHEEQARDSRHHPEPHKAQRRECSFTAPLDGARHGRRDHSDRRRRDEERGESSAIIFTRATPPSHSPSAGGAASAAASAGTLVYPAPPPSERVHIYPRMCKGGHRGGPSVDNGGSASVAPRAAVSPLHHQRYAAATTDAPAAAPLSHVRRKLDWRAANAATVAGVNAVDAPADESVVSAEALVASRGKSSTPASSAQLLEQHTVSSSTSSRLPPVCRHSSTAAADPRSTSEAYRTVLVHEEGEARMRIAMAHDSHLFSILRDHYERLRQLERESKPHALATTIETANGADESATTRGPAPVAALKAAAVEDVSHLTNFSSSTLSSSSLTAFAASAQAEMSREAHRSQPAQMPPTKSRACSLDWKGVPDEAPPPPSTSTTAAADAKLENSVLLPPPQRPRPAWKKSSTTSSRASASPSSAAASVVSRLPERRLLAHHKPPVVLDDSRTTGALSALSATAAAPAATASASVSALHPPVQGSQCFSLPPAQSPVSAHEALSAATVEEEDEEYAECTASVTPRVHRRPSHARSCPLLSPLDESAKAAAAQNAASNSYSTSTAVSTDSSSSSAAYRVVPERVEERVSSGTGAIAAELEETGDDGASMTGIFCEPSPLPGAKGNGAGLEEARDEVPLGPPPNGAAPRPVAVAVELFPGHVAHASAACAPLPRKPPISSPPPLPSVPGMNAVGNVVTVAANVAELVSAKDEADAVSFSSVSSFHGCSLESPIARGGTAADDEAASSAGTPVESYVGEPLDGGDSPPPACSAGRS